MAYGTGTVTPRRYKGAITRANPKGIVHGEWRLRVNLGTGPDGKRVEFFETFKGNKTEANRRLSELVAERANLIPARRRKPPPQTLPIGVIGAGLERPTYDLDQAKLAYYSNSGGYGKTVADLMAKWLDHIEQRGRSRSYVTQARRKTKVRILPVLGPIPLDRLDAQRLDTFYSALLREGLKPSTVRQLHALLASALHQAVRWDWIERSPTDRATPPTVRAPDLPVPTPEDVRALVEAADGVLRRAITLAALTGARRGELCSLRWRDLDVETGTLTIARAMANGIEGPTKTHQIRTLAIDPADLGEPGQPDSFILTGTATPASANMITQWFRDLVDKLEMPHFRFHDLRHFAATTLIAAGVDPRTVTSRQGWGSMQMLDRYTGKVTERDKAAAGVLAKSLAK